LPNTENQLIYLLIPQTAN